MYSIGYLYHKYYYNYYQLYSSHWHENKQHRIHFSRYNIHKTIILTNLTELSTPTGCLVDFGSFFFSPLNKPV